MVYTSTHNTLYCTLGVDIDTSVDDYGLVEQNLVLSFSILALYLDG